MGSYLHTVFIVGKFNSIKSIFRLLIQVAVKPKKKNHFCQILYHLYTHIFQILECSLHFKVILSMLVNL